MFIMEEKIVVKSLQDYINVLDKITEEIKIKPLTTILMMAIKYNIL